MTNPGGSALWGLLRSFAQEAPSCIIGGTDADPASVGTPLRPSIQLSELPAATGALSDGYGTALRGGSNWAARLLPSGRSVGVVGASAGGFHLVPQPRGSLGSLVPEALPSGPLPAGTVEVSVRAIGLNFRDLLNILDVYPGDPGPPGKNLLPTLHPLLCSAPCL